MTNDYVANVINAKAGDLHAFRHLVIQFQDHVTGFAFSWVGDVEIARDVAQEVFLEAHLCLHQLSEPAAFPGWLRRIVVKRCDRVTRRNEPLSKAQDAIPEDGSGDIDPSHLAQRAEQAEQLRYAISALPEQQRMVVALNYFADITGEEVARFLELPLTTVKKRLFEARRKLRDHGEQLMQKSIEHMKPSVDAKFSEETAFFIALRERDYDEMHALIERTPDLVNAEQNWSHELAHQRVLPFPNKATALITAVELDDLELLDFLLDRGADPDGRCGCATGESAVWTAALFNRTRQMRLLLARGANPNVFSAAGNTPLQVAAMRGHTEVVRILLSHGADTRVTDARVGGTPPLITADATRSTPRTAGEWARINGFDALADEIEGQKHETSSRANCAIACRGDLVETGIRAIDFFAPIERRSLVRFPFAAGVGMVVLLGEMSLRFSAAKDTAVVWTGFAQPPFDKQDFEAEIAEFGLTSTIIGELASFRDSAELRRAVFERGVLAIERLRDSGKHVLAIVLSTQGFEQDVEASYPRLMADTETGAVSTIVVAPFKEEGGPWRELQSPFTAQWTLDRKRANRRLYPAIDPTLSPAAAPLSARHRELRARVVDVLDDYIASDPDLESFDTETSGIKTADCKAHRLLRYLSQPFKIATPFGGLPAEFTPLSKQLDRIEQLLDDPVVLTVAAKRRSGDTS